MKSRPVSGITMTSTIYNTMKSFDSLNLSKLSLNNSKSSAHIRSVVSSPGRKSNLKKETEEEYIPNQNKITLKKSDSYNLNSITKSWVDLNIMNEHQAKNENGNLNSYNMFITRQIKKLPADQSNLRGKKEHIHYNKALLDLELNKGNLTYEQRVSALTSRLD